MNNPRLEQLFKFLEEDPEDPFNLYAIALEYLNDDKVKAREYFDKLLSQHEKYVPVYYHAASLYRKLGKQEKAAEIYEKGITTARNQNNQHALRELRAAYNEFLYEGED